MRTIASNGGLYAQKEALAVGKLDLSTLHENDLAVLARYGDKEAVGYFGDCPQNSRVRLSMSSYPLPVGGQGRP